MRVSVGSGGCFPSVMVFEFEARRDAVRVCASDRWHASLRVEVDWSAAEFEHFVEQFLATIETNLQLHATPPNDDPSRPPPAVPSPWLHYELGRAQGAVSCSRAAASHTAEWLGKWMTWSAGKRGANVLHGAEALPEVRRGLVGRAWDALQPWLLLYAIVAVVSFVYWLTK